MSTLGLAGCASGPGGAGGSERTVTVYAAASLKKPFTALGTTFEQEHPGVTVKFNFAGSSDLAAQIKAGAPADVLATADERTMKLVTDAHLSDGLPRTFTRNTLAIVVPRGNPAHVRTLADLTRPGTKVVTCAPAVPCGKAAATVEKRAKLTLRPVSEEAKVTDVLAKVTSGDADAGIVYVSDAKSAPKDVQTVAIPPAVNVVNTYPMGVVKDAQNAELAREFNALVGSSRGQQTLKDAGFLSAG